LGGDGGAASGRWTSVAADGEVDVRGMFDGARNRAVLVVGEPDEPFDARIGLASVLVVGEGEIEVEVDGVHARGAVLNDLAGGRRDAEAWRVGGWTGDGVDVERGAAGDGGQRQLARCRQPLAAAEFVARPARSGGPVVVLGDPGQFDAAGVFTHIPMMPGDRAQCAGR